MVNSLTPTVLRLITFPLIEKGVYGRINNLPLIISISLVCKKWREWIYSEEGPFSLLPERVKPNPTTLLELNRLLFKSGKGWFKFVNNFKHHIPDEIDLNNNQINDLDWNGKTPLAYVAVDNPNSKPLIQYLIKHGANPIPALIKIFNLTNLPTKKRFLLADEILKDNKSSINALDPHGYGFIHYFPFTDIHTPEAEILTWYKNNNGDLNLISKDNQTVIQIKLNDVSLNENKRSICSKNKTPQILINALISLVQAGASIDQPDHQLNYLLHTLTDIPWDQISLQMSNLLGLILQKNPEQLYAENSQGQTPLCCAIRKGHTTAMKTFLNFIQFDIFSDKTKKKFLQAFLDCLSEYFGKPILDFDYHNTFRKLIQIIYNSDRSSFEIPDDNGNTFYHHCAFLCPAFTLLKPESKFHLKNNLGETVDDIIIKRQNTLDLYHECENALENIEKIKTLLKGPVELNMTFSKNNLLHILINVVSTEYTRYITVLKMLLAHGIKPNVRNSDDLTPLGLFYKLNKDVPDTLVFTKIKVLLKNYGAHQ